MISYKIPLPRRERVRVKVEIAAHLSGARNDTSPCLCEADEVSRSNLGGEQRDCHAEFILSGGEILRLQLRMTRSEGLATTI